MNERSYARCAAQVRRSKTRIECLGRVWRWQERCRAFDSWNDALRLPELAEARQKANESSLQLIEKTKNLIASRLATIDSAAFSPRDLLYGLRILVQIETLLLGGVTSRIELSTPDRIACAQRTFVEALTLFKKVDPAWLRIQVAAQFRVQAADLIVDATPDFLRIGLTD